MRKEKRISVLSKRNEELECKIVQLSNELEKDKNLKEEYRNKMAILLNNFESLRLDFKDNLANIEEKESELDNLIKDLKSTLKDIKYRKWYNIFHKHGD
jgi:predicted  nucleic acid-binding Zn-ribbon protein